MPLLCSYSFIIIKSLVLFLVKRAGTVQPSLSFCQSFHCFFLHTAESGVFPKVRVCAAQQCNSQQLVCDMQFTVVANKSNCELRWQGASYSGAHPVFVLSLHRLFELQHSCCSVCNERVISANAQCSGLIQNPPCKSCTDLAVLRPIGAFPPAQQCIL